MKNFKYLIYSILFANIIFNHSYGSSYQDQFYDYPDYKDYTPTKPVGYSIDPCGRITDEDLEKSPLFNDFNKAVDDMLQPFTGQNVYTNIDSIMTIIENISNTIYKTRSKILEALEFRANEKLMGPNPDNPAALGICRLEDTKAAVDETDLTNADVKITDSLSQIKIYAQEDIFIRNDFIYHTKSLHKAITTSYDIEHCKPEISFPAVNNSLIRLNNSLKCVSDALKDLRTKSARNYLQDHLRYSLVNISASLKKSILRSLPGKTFIYVMLFEDVTSKAFFESQSYSSYGLTYFINLRSDDEQNDS